MRLPQLILCSALFITTAASAQQTPWAKLPKTKSIESIDGSNKVLQLKLDTLLQQKEEGFPSFLQLHMQPWYASSTK